MKSVPLVLAFLMVGCGSAIDPLPEIDPICAVLPGDDVAMKLSEAGRSYFPASFGKPTQVCNFKGYPECFATISTVENDWYPSHWDAADEPSLYERSRFPATAGTSTLRFTWLPSFHHPVIVRIERTGHGARLVAKQLSGKGGYEPGVIEREVTRPLSATEVAKLDVILSTTKVLEQRPTECDSGLDGSQWIVEGINRDGYVFVNRWSPQEGSVHEFGDFALLLTGWTFEERY